MKHRKVKYLKVIIPVALVLGVVVGIVLWAGKPHSGTISPPPTTIAPTTYYDKKLEGKYITFQYSGKYIARDEKAVNNNLELHSLNADTHYDKRIMASVVGMPTGSLDRNGDYLYRRNSPAVYKSRTVHAGNKVIEVWVRNDGSEQTAMIPHGDKAAVISFVTASNSDSLTAEVDALLNTFQWNN